MAEQKEAAEVKNPFRQFLETLRKAMEVKEDVKFSNNFLNRVTQQLRDYRQGNIVIKSSVAQDVVNLMEEDEDFCSRIGPRSLGIILDLFLQTEKSRIKEQGLYLLAKSLYTDNLDAERSRTIETRKAAIGTTCLQRLLAAFSNDKENEWIDSVIRRPVGLVLIQLLSGCDKNMENLEAGPEDLRRELGPLLVIEKDDILRIIRGELLQVLITAGDNKLSLADLWPDKPKSRQMYDGFPEQSQDHDPWINAFQHYIDGLFDKQNPPEPPVGSVYFVQGFEVPSYNIRFYRRTISVVVNAGISIYALPSKDTFDDFFDIPPNLVWNVEMKDIPINDPRVEERPVKLVVSLRKSNDDMCYHNGSEVLTGQIEFTVSNRDAANSFLNDIRTPQVGVGKTSPQREASSQVPVPVRKQKVSQPKSPIDLSQDQNNDDLRSEGAGQGANNGRDEPPENITSKLAPPGTNNGHCDDTHGQQRIETLKPKQRDQDSEVDELLGPDSRKQETNHTHATGKKPKVSIANHDDKAKTNKQTIIRRNAKRGTVQDEPRGSSLADEYSLEDSNDKRKPPLSSTQAAETETINADHNVKPKTKKYSLKTKSPIRPAESGSTQPPAPGASRGKGRNPRARGAKSTEEHVTTRGTEKPELPKKPKAASKQNKSANTKKGKGSESSDGDHDEQPTKSIAKPEDGDVHTSAPKQVVPAPSRTRRKAAADAKMRIQKMSSSENGDDEVEDESNHSTRSKTGKIKAGGKKNIPNVATRQSSRSKEKKAKEAITREPEVAEAPIDILDDQESTIDSDDVDPDARENVHGQDNPSILDGPEEMLGQETNFFEDGIVYQDVGEHSGHISETRTMAKTQPVESTVDFAKSLSTILKDNLNDRPPDINDAQYTTGGQSPNIKQTLLSSGVKQRSTKANEHIEKQDTTHTPHDEQEAAQNDNLVPSVSGEKREASDEYDIRPGKRTKKSSDTLVTEDHLRSKTPATRSIVRVTPGTPAKQPSQSRKKRSVTPPTRRSPRLLALAQAATVVEKEAVTEHRELVDDHLARKPPMVGFSASGPMNQGFSSGKASSKGNRTSVHRTEGVQLVIGTSDPKPAQEEMTEKMAENGQDQDVPIQRDDVINQSLQSMPLQSRRQDLAGRKSSQISASQRPRTVTDDGSPIGSQKTSLHMNNMETIARQLMDTSMAETNDETISEPIHPDFGDFEDELPTLLNEDISGLEILNNYKTQPSSPHEIVQPLVPHRRTNTGRYEELASNQIISPHREPANPFIGSNTSMKVTKLTKRFQADKPVEQRKARKAPLPISVSQPVFERRMEDPDKTLVEVEPFSPEELSSEGSYESQDDDQCTKRANIDDDTENLEDEWRMALKPHQKTILDTLYQISNDLLRLLMEPEEAIDNVLEDYIRNAKVLLQDTEDRHRRGRNDIHHDLLGLTKGLYKYYKECHASVRQKSKDTKASSILDIEKSWLQQQNELQNLFQNRANVPEEATDHAPMAKRRNKTNSTRAGFEHNETGI